MREALQLLLIAFLELRIAMVLITTSIGNWLHPISPVPHFLPAA